jgi:hypothetical protein
MNLGNSPLTGQDPSLTQIQQNQQQTGQQSSQASVGVLTMPLVGRAIVGAEEGAEGGGAAGTVEPGGGNLVGAVVGAVAGAVVAAAAPTMYAKAKDEASKAWQKFKTAHEHLTSSEKLGGPDKDPRRGWKQTVRRIADSMDEHADRITSQKAANAIRFGADLLRSWIPE